MESTEAMVNIADIEDKGILRIRVDIGEELGLEDSAVFVVFREPSGLEMLHLMRGQNAGDDVRTVGRQVLDRVSEIILDCLIDHNIAGKGGAAQADLKAVRKIVENSSRIFMKCLQAFMGALPLLRTTGESSEDSPVSDSAEAIPDDIENTEELS